MDEKIWVGIDVGRHAHHAAAVDEAGTVLWSRRLPNDQPAIEALMDRVADMDGDTGKAAGELPVEPNYTIETSPGNGQPFWLFDRALPPAEARPLAAART